MKKIILLVTTFCCFVLASNIVNAEKKQLVVGTSTGYPPYYFKNKDRLVGVCIDIIDYVARSLDIKVVYRQYPWNRMLYNGEQGKVDAIMPLFKTEKRTTYLDFPEQALAIEENSFFTWKQVKINFDGNYLKLKPYRIGVIANYSYGKIFDQIDFLQKEEAINDQSLIKKFKLKRFDVGIGNEYVINYHAKNLGIVDHIVFLKPSVTKDNLYIGFSKKNGDPTLSKKFSQALLDLKRTDKYQNILKHYGIK